MANCLNYDCNDPIGDHMPNDCDELLLGGVNSIILLECDSQLTDPSNASQIVAELAAGRAVQIDNVKVSIEAASPITIDPPVSCSTPKLINYDRSGTLIDGNVSDNNISVYNQIFGGRSFGGVILNLCGTEDSVGGPQVLWIDSKVELNGSLIVPANNNEVNRFEGKFTWRSKGDPSMYAQPSNIFP